VKSWGGGASEESGERHGGRRRIQLLREDNEFFPVATAVTQAPLQEACPGRPAEVNGKLFDFSMSLMKKIGVK